MLFFLFKRIYLYCLLILVLGYFAIHFTLFPSLSLVSAVLQPDSLGPLDLDVPTTKYHSEDLLLSDSLSGLNRLIASSLDAFQNCSFFGVDKKEAPSTVEVQETATLSEFKIGSGT